MMQICSSTLLRSAAICFFVLLAQALASPTYEICKGDGEDCQSVSYRADDATKGKGCRFACSRQRENLTANVSACFRPQFSQSCSPYVVYGRDGYDKTFEKHVDCVKVCHFVGKVEHSSANSFEICPDIMDRCFNINRKDGSYDAFNKCIFKCDGWTTLGKTREASAYFSAPSVSDDLAVKGKYFYGADARAPFRELKKCLEDCIAG